MTKWKQIDESTPTDTLIWVTDGKNTGWGKLEYITANNEGACNVGDNNFRFYATHWDESVDYICKSKDKFCVSLNSTKYGGNFMSKCHCSACIPQCNTIMITSGEALKLERNWISVDDQLPTKEGRIVIRIGKKIFIGWATNGGIFGPGVEVWYHLYSKKWEKPAHFTDVTHWFPLPDIEEEDDDC